MIPPSNGQKPIVVVPEDCPIPGCARLVREIHGALLGGFDDNGESYTGYLHKTDDRFERQEQRIAALEAPGKARAAWWASVAATTTSWGVATILGLGLAAAGALLGWSLK